MNEYKHIDLATYARILQQPNWHVVLAEELKHFYEPVAELNEQQQAQRKEITQLVANCLQAGSVYLAESGENEDQERKPIDTIIIHHSHGDSDATLEHIDALGLLRLYVPEYLKPERKDRAIWSGHFFEGRQTFIAYHYLIRRDGSVHHVLQDSQIGWQAGNWDINCRSIAICFLDNLDESWPTQEALVSAQKIIAKYDGVQVLGHREINTKTACPGERFLGKNGWGKQLLG